MFWRLKNIEWLILFVLILIGYVLKLGTILSLFGIGIAVYAIYYYFINIIPLRRKEQGFKYVYVEYDGSVRECAEDEKADMCKPSEGSGRFYIKDRYKEKNMNGNFSGYIRRRRVPQKIIIEPSG